jgi:predicted  nucleic acid-binding Zn-ribbon protein
MTETTPHYFVKFLKEFNRVKDNVIETGQGLKEFRKEVNKRFDAQDEQIADLSVRVTKIEGETNGLRESIKRIDNRLDQNSALITIAIKKDAEQDIRITKLEDQLA